MLSFEGILHQRDQFKTGISVLRNNPLKIPDPEVPNHH